LTSTEHNLQPTAILKIYYGIFLVVLLFFLALNKGDLVLYFNERHGWLADGFFKYFTILGDGVVMGGAVFLALFYRYRAAITLALSGILLALTTNVLKQPLFSENLRPMRYYEGVVDLVFVSGVDVHGLNSFPSGHTATAAALAIWLALEFRSHWVSSFALLYALLIGLSRIYLAQHFFADVTAGLFIGFSIGAASYFAVNKVAASNTKFERSLLSLRFS
jgi:membrane-associated phospholipid phosphatase